MALKIKWNDDRVRGAATALLLIARARLGRGETDDLIKASLAEYRHDPEACKKNRATWADVDDPGPLTDSQQMARYKKLRSSVDALLKKLGEGKRHFNSLTELDNFLVVTLENRS